MRLPQIIAVIAASVSFNPVVAAPAPIQETADIVEIRDFPFSLPTFPTLPTAFPVLPSLPSLPTLISFPSITIPGVTFPLDIPDLTNIFNGITAEVASLQGSVASINIPSALLAIIGQGPIPALIAGITNITNTIEAVVSQIPILGPVLSAAPGDDGLALMTAFNNALTNVEQFILNFIAQINAVQSIFPVSPSLVQILQTLEQAIDTLVTAFGAAIPGASGQAVALEASLNAAFSGAITAFTS